MNIGQDASLSNDNVTKKFIQFLVVSDGKLNMTGNDSLLFVVTGGVPSQLENLVGKIQTLIKGLGYNMQPVDVKLFMFTTQIIVSS